MIIKSVLLMNIIIIIVVQIIISIFFFLLFFCCYCCKCIIVGLLTHDKNHSDILGQSNLLLSKSMTICSHTTNKLQLTKQQILEM